MRLLLAEDDPRLLKSLTHIFEANRFVTDGVSNGRMRCPTHCPENMTASSLTL